MEILPNLTNLDYVISIVYLYEDYNKCVPKEIGITSLDYSFVENWIIKSRGSFADLPSSVKYVNDIQSTFIHGIHWTEGTIEPNELAEFLKKLSMRAYRVYTKSSRDARYLEKHMCRTVINIADIGNKELYNKFIDNEYKEKSLRPCLTHALKPGGSRFKCALDQACLLRKYIHSVLPENKRKSTPSRERSLEIYNFLYNSTSWKYNEISENEDLFNTSEEETYNELDGDTESANSGEN